MADSVLNILNKPLAEARMVADGLAIAQPFSLYISKVIYGLLNKTK